MKAAVISSQLGHYVQGDRWPPADERNDQHTKSIVRLKI